MRRVSFVGSWILAALVLGVGAEVHLPMAARAERLELRRQSLELPGAPASIVSTDLDGDGRRDLVIVVVYREWGEIGEDRFEDMMQIVEVVPALFDRREIHAYLAGPDGALRMAGPPLPIERSVLSIQEGPPGIPAIALTDEGVSKLSLADGEGEGEGPALILEPLLEEPPVMAGSESYLPKLSLVDDVDGDGIPDLFFPARDAIAVHRGTGTGLATTPSARLVMPGFHRYWGRVGTVSYPLPTVQDVNGDDLPDLVVQKSDGSAIHVLLGKGGGEFHEPVELAVPETDRDENTKESDAELAHFGDVDGSGTVEIVTLAEVDTGKSDIKEAKKPKFRYRFYRVSSELEIEEAPYQKVDVEGHPFGAGDWPEITEAVFRDLDRDGREDVVTVTLRFSMLQVLKVLATKKVGVGIDFHIYRQEEGGKFREVSGLDLHEKLKIDLNDFKLNRFAQFAGDFDGDGLSDFVRMGGSRTFTIHRGEPGCRYSKKADLTIELEEEPLDLALVQIRDIDGDDRADLLLSYPVPPEESELVAPVRLELYFSGAAE